MKLDLEWLKTRHEYWKYEIGKKGIWNPLNFSEIEIEIHRKSRNYNGLFCRKTIIRNNRREYLDRIFIYRNSEEFEEGFIDSVLVHEMIHQYIIQNKIKDTSTHGRYFRNIMARINKEFSPFLNIKISSRNPLILEKGKGNIIHHLLIVESGDYCWVCVIHPSKKAEYERKMKRNTFHINLAGYRWAQSDDVYFSRFRRCMKGLHGIKKKREEMQKFCEEYRIV